MSSLFWRRRSDHERGLAYGGPGGGRKAACFSASLTATNLMPDRTNDEGNLFYGVSSVIAVFDTRDLGTLMLLAAYLPLRR